jgi:hypothetical protein
MAGAVTLMALTLATSPEGAAEVPTLRAYVEVGQSPWRSNLGQHARNRACARRLLGCSVGRDRIHSCPSHPLPLAPYPTSVSPPPQLVWRLRSQVLAYSLMCLGYGLYLFVSFNVVAGYGIKMKQVGVGVGRGWGGARPAAGAGAWLLRRSPGLCTAVCKPQGRLPLQPHNPTPIPTPQSPTPPQMAIYMLLAMAAGCLSMGFMPLWLPPAAEYAPAAAVTVSGGLYLALAVLDWAWQQVDKIKRSIT